MIEPHISFWHAWLKIVWANKLISDLNAEIERFIERKPYKIALEPDRQRGGYIFDVRLTEHLPYTIPCLIGDICHNLRASSDFCWMGLLRSIDPNAAKKTLPIEPNAKGIETTVAKLFEGETLAKVMDLLVNRIKSHYDFEAGGNRALHALNGLSNWQKHNMLVPSPGVTQLGVNTIIKSDDGSTIDLSLAKVDGRVAFIGGSHAEMSYDSEPTVQILIDFERLTVRQPVVPTLLNFKECAAEVLKAFCEIWPSDTNPVVS